MFLPLNISGIACNMNDDADDATDNAPETVLYPLLHHLRLSELLNLPKFPETFNFYCLSSRFGCFNRHSGCYRIQFFLNPFIYHLLSELVAVVCFLLYQCHYCVP